MKVSDVSNAVVIYWNEKGEKADGWFLERFLAIYIRLEPKYQYEGEDFRRFVWKEKVGYAVCKVENRDFCDDAYHLYKVEENGQCCLLDALDGNYFPDRVAVQAWERAYNLLEDSVY